MPASKPKTPSASGISRLLASAGFEKSESSATRVRGWRSHSPGFVVRRGESPGEVRVHHELGFDAVVLEQALHLFAAIA